MSLVDSKRINWTALDKLEDQYGSERTEACSADAGMRREGRILDFTKADPRSGINRSVNFYGIRTLDSGTWTYQLIC